jgi:hypothetical protein
MRKPHFISIDHIGGFAIMVNRQDSCAGRIIPFGGTPGPRGTSKLTSTAFAALDSRLVIALR